MVDFPIFSLKVKPIPCVQNDTFKVINDLHFCMKMEHLVRCYGYIISRFTKLNFTIFPYVTRHSRLPNLAILTYDFGFYDYSFKMIYVQLSKHIDNIQPLSYYRFTLDHEEKGGNKTKRSQ